MSSELEAAAADALPHLVGGRHGFTPATGAACANCGTILQGRYCHACSQDADTHKRSIGHLAWEAIEGLFHLDGRLLRTLPALFLRPGDLARDYMEGRIVRHVPPFRTFLVALLLFIFAAEEATHEIARENARQAQARAAPLATPQGRAAEAARVRRDAAQERAAELKDAAQERAGELRDADAKPARVEATYAREVARTEARYAKQLQKADRVAAGLPEPPPALTPHPSGKDWFKQSLRKATEAPEYYFTVMFAWGHRFAVLLLPIVGLSLALVYRRRREVFIYDHLLVAMNLLSFAFLLSALGLVLPGPVRPWWFGLVTLWWPVNLFQTLRGAYGSGVVGALLKTVFVWTMTVTATFVLLVALLVFSLTQL